MGEKMKKGFTLVELLGVIVILGIVGVIVTPLIMNAINESRQTASDSQKIAIERAAKNYVNANMYTIDDKCKTAEGCKVSIATLKKEGFLEDKVIKDAITEEVITDSDTVTISKNGNRYKYTFNG